MTRKVKGRGVAKGPRARRVWLLALSISAAACEHGITLRGTIAVPVEVQREFSRARPGVVLVEASLPKSSSFTYRVAVLCEAEPAAVVAPFLHDDFGCAKEGVVHAWVAAADPGTTPCGVGQERVADTPSTPPRASGEQTVFEGQRGSWGCSSGSDTIAIVVHPLR